MITMLLGGLWHGAGWHGVIWGGWHGLLLVLTHRIKPRASWTSRQVTFALIVLGWVQFRADGLTAAGRMFASMSGARGLGTIDQSVQTMLIASLFLWVWVNFVPNSFELAYRTPQRLRYAMLAGSALACCAIFFGTKTDFLYFQF
jgi:D-alanyl-lipoteichoic acid acyltransferase DltB (MBOAT superfamily)